MLIIIITLHVFCEKCQNFTVMLSIKINFLNNAVHSCINFRDIIRNAVNASEHDAVLFTGSGCTAAVHKLIHALDLKEPPVSSENVLLKLRRRTFF